MEQASELETEPEEAEEETEEEEAEKAPVFAQPSVLTPKSQQGATEEQMQQAAGEVLNLKQQGYNDSEITDYIAQKYGFDHKTAKLTSDTLMRFLEKRTAENREVQKQALGLVPTLAQSDNPLAGLAIQSLIEKAGLNKEESFVSEIVSLQKDIAKAKIAAEMMKDVWSEGKEKGATPSQQTTTDPLLAQLVKSALEDKKQIEQNFYQLLMAQAQGARSEEIAQLTDAIKQSIDALNQKIEAAMLAQGREVPEVQEEKPKDPVEEMAQFAERLKQMQEAMKALGFEVKAPGGEDPARLYEMQTKVKELELKQKEVEARQAFYSKLAEALSKPETLSTIFDGLSKLFSGILGRGPAPQVIQSAMTQSATVPVEPISPPADVPKLEDFIKEGAKSAGAKKV